MAFDGWGSNCFCIGGICFSSEAVKEWSDMRNRIGAANDDYAAAEEGNSKGDLRDSLTQ